MTIKSIKSARTLSRMIPGLLMLVVLSFGAGCASSPAPASSNPMRLSIKSDPELNPDANGRPSPLKIVFYELKSVAAFESADFFSLSQKDLATLGAELLEKEEFFIKPGEIKKITLKGNPAATNIGIFAEFRDIDKAVWRATAVIPAREELGMLSKPLSMLKAAPLSREYAIELKRKTIRILP